MDWTSFVWRLLCLLAGMSLLAVIAGLLPDRWLPVPVAAWLLIGLLVVVAGLHDSEQHSEE